MVEPQKPKILLGWSYSNLLKDLYKLICHEHVSVVNLELFLFKESSIELYLKLEPRSHLHVIFHLVITVNASDKTL